MYRKVAKVLSPLDNKLLCLKLFISTELYMLILFIVNTSFLQMVASSCTI